MLAVAKEEDMVHKEEQEPKEISERGKLDHKHFRKPSTGFL
jgi:hypothetical protein